LFKVLPKQRKGKLQPIDLTSWERRQESLKYAPLHPIDPNTWRGIPLRTIIYVLHNLHVLFYFHHLSFAWRWRPVASLEAGIEAFGLRSASAISRHIGRINGPGFRFLVQVQDQDQEDSGQEEGRKKGARRGTRNYE
jgi:hypothetical protein